MAQPGSHSCPSLDKPAHVDLGAPPGRPWHSRGPVALHALPLSWPSESAAGQVCPQPPKTAHLTTNGAPGLGVQWGLGPALGKLQSWGHRTPSVLIWVSAHRTLLEDNRRVYQVRLQHPKTQPPIGTLRTVSALRPGRVEACLKECGLQQSHLSRACSWHLPPPVGPAPGTYSHYSPGRPPLKAA